MVEKVRRLGRVSKAIFIVYLYYLKIIDITYSKKRIQE